MYKLSFQTQGRPVKSEMFEAPIKSTQDALDRLVGGICHRNCILEGCTVTYGGGKFSITNGLVLIDGVVYRVYAHDLTSGKPCALIVSKNPVNVAGSLMTKDAGGTYYANTYHEAILNADSVVDRPYNPLAIRAYGQDTLDTSFFRSIVSRLWEQDSNNETGVTFSKYVDETPTNKRVKEIIYKHRFTGTNVISITVTIPNVGFLAGEIIGFEVCSFKDYGSPFHYVQSNIYTIILNEPSSPTDRELIMQNTEGGFFTIDAYVTVKYMIVDTDYPI